jgi:hypothetical protein
VQSAAPHYKLIKKIKDERFDEELIHQYALHIFIGTRDFQVTAIDPDNRVLLLEDYVLPSVSSSTSLLTTLDQIYDAHALLKAGFWKSITIGFKNQKFVQVPASLFIERALSDYLRFNAQLDAEREELHYVLPAGSDTVTVFAVHRETREWLDGIYANNKPRFTHQSAALIEGVKHYANQRTDNPLYIYVDRFKLHILSITRKQLVYYNQFSIQHFSDYVKYIMLVMKSLGMDQKTSEVVLWGYVGKNSPHYHEFYKYIQNVTYGNRPGHLIFGYLFDEVQEHHFFDLFSLTRALGG